MRSWESQSLPYSPMMPTWLDIAVDNVLGMQIIHSLEQLPDDALHVSLWQPLGMSVQIFKYCKHALDRFVIDANVGCEPAVQLLRSPGLPVRSTYSNTK